MNLSFSFVIPVYNRPDEVGELLESLASQTYSEPFEVVLVEDGSTVTSDQIIADFRNRHPNIESTDTEKSPSGNFDKDTSKPFSGPATASTAIPRFSINYLQKLNTGPGNSRNFGMSRAKGDYFIILDSDCIVPPDYLTVVAESLYHNFVHCFGGPDAAHESFTLVQKAINYAMTAVLTTGGIRGGKRRVQKPTAETANLDAAKSSADATFRPPSSKSKKHKNFQPRSFNMGLSRLAFESTGGFGNIHPGEDPDLVFRLWGQGYVTRLFPKAFVYHKRRIDWQKFYRQVRKFGMVRPILNRRYPKTAKMTYWFPTFFCLGFLVALVFWFWGIVLPIGLYALYFVLIFIDSFLQNRSLAIALLSLLAVGIQFIGYGFGFLKSAIFVNFSNKRPEELFPDLFFPKADKAL